jgi:hypothetical protein
MDIFVSLPKENDSGNLFPRKEEKGKVVGFDSRYL